VQLVYFDFNFTRDFDSISIWFLSGCGVGLGSWHKNIQIWKGSLFGNHTKVVLQDLHRLPTFVWLTRRSYEKVKSISNRPLTPVLLRFVWSWIRSGAGILLHNSNQPLWFLSDTDSSWNRLPGKYVLETWKLFIKTSFKWISYDLFAFYPQKFFFLISKKSK